MTAANSNEARNTMSPIESTITAIMNDAASGANKQANLVVALFNNDTSFANDVLIGMLRKEKADRTQARETLLVGACHEYAKALRTAQDLKDKKKANRTEKEGFALTTWHNKIRAANIMFERAAITVVGLRDQKAKSVKPSPIGAGALEIKVEDADGDLVKYRTTATAALQASTKVVNKLLGRTEVADRTQARQAIENVDRYVTLCMASQSYNSLADFPDTTEKALEGLFANLFRLRFGVGKDVDMKAVAAFAAELAAEDKRLAA